ncbi:hypothetical protein D3C86_1652610 [compost metagenome]
MFYQEIGANLYNLAFGDTTDDGEGIDDQTVSNNSDTQKVLNTVAATLSDFINTYPSAKIFAEGSTAPRTRLYQISIAQFWSVIQLEFEVEGYYDKKWEKFVKGRNYSAFTVYKKY